MKLHNKDEKTIADFGKEWKFYSQKRLSDYDSRSYFDAYFEIFPWSKINGINNMINPAIIKRKNNKVINVANKWLNFNLRFKKSKMGFPISVKINDTTK